MSKIAVRANHLSDKTPSRVQAGVIPPRYELDKISIDKTTKYLRIHDAGYSLGEYGTVGYDLHIVVDAHAFNIYILATALGGGFSREIGFADSVIESMGFYKDPFDHPHRGCFGMRQDVLPDHLSQLPHCSGGVPYRELRLGAHNQDGRHSLMVIPEARSRGVATNMCAFLQEVAKRMGAKYRLLSDGRFEELQIG